MKIIGENHKSFPPCDKKGGRAVGPPGEPGEAATIEIAEVITVEPEEAASVINVGDEHAAKLKLYIPRGSPGNKGDAGEKGEAGARGANGSNGISCTHSWKGTVLTVSSASGTSSADLKGDKGDTGAQGAKGDKGDKGEAGAQGDKGDKGEPGYTPVKGTDYFTEKDLAEIQTMIDNTISALDATEVRY